MIDDNTTKIINAILTKMEEQVWQKSHKWVTYDDFEKLKQVRDNYPDKNLAQRIWEKNKLPSDDNFSEHKIAMTEELMALLDNTNTLNYHFSLSAQDIIDKHIPPRIAACTGHAKLFSYFAKEYGLDCRVLLTADLRGYAAQKQRKDLIDGHQIIAVRGTDGSWVAFDPAHKQFQELKDKTEIKVGNYIQSVEDEKYGKFKITAILSPDAFSKVNSYLALENLYLYGDSKVQRFKTATGKLKESRPMVLEFVKHMIQTEYQNN